jgi:hypothetical protein
MRGSFMGDSMELPLAGSAPGSRFMSLELLNSSGCMMFRPLLGTKAKLGR